jgi:hypothetical protein
VLLKSQRDLETGGFSLQPKYILDIPVKQAARS